MSFCLSESDEQPQSVNFDLLNGSPFEKNSFIAVHWNINSILTEGRLEELIENVNTLKCHVVILTESKLDSSIPSNLLSIPGFHEPLRRDRNRHGGGCLVYVSQLLTFKQQVQIQSDFFENISVDVRVREKVYSINCYYRPPNADNHESFLFETEQMLCRLNKHKAHTKLIMSDLNFGNIYCKYPVLTPKPLDLSAPELFSSYNFQQLIDIPTRMTTNTTSLIDLVFSSNIDDIQCQGTVSPIADHEGVFVCFHCISVQEKTSTRNVYDFKNIDEVGLRQFIKSYDFQSNVFSKPVLQQAEAMSSILIAAQNKFVPVKQISITPTDQPWMNSYTRLLLRKKNRNYRIFKKVNLHLLSVVGKHGYCEELVTRLRDKKSRAHKRSRISAKESSKANLRAKMHILIL